MSNKIANAVMMVLACFAGCTFNTQVDVGTGQGDGGGTGDGGATTGLGATSFGEVTGEPATTADSSESSGATTSEGTGSSGEESSGTTGEPTDCPDGMVGMVDFRCTCTLDNEARAIDPAECGCDLVWGPAGGDCTCDGVAFPLVSCGWECTDITGSCLCGGFSAPTTWCGGEPVICEGDAEIDVGGTERCACSNTFGLPKEPLDPALCGCAQTVDNACECDGIVYADWVCGWPCTLQMDFTCACGVIPAPLSACALP